MALTGNLAETSFTDLIQFYSISRQTAAVTIVSPAGPDADGILYIEGGDVVDARFGEHFIGFLSRAFGQKKVPGFSNGHVIHYYDLGPVKVAPGNVVAPLFTVANPVRVKVTV